jgi:hypothetical protein
MLSIFYSVHNYAPLKYYVSSFCPWAYTFAHSDIFPEFCTCVVWNIESLSIHIIHLEQNFFIDGSKAIMDIHNVDYTIPSNA